MKQSGGWWFPDEEAHFPVWLAKNGINIDGRLAYQGKKWQAALGFCRSFRTAVDIGGHVGTHSYYLAKRFSMVIAFEPVRQFRECFERNVEADNVKLYPMALGAAPNLVGMHVVPSDTGGTYVSGAGDIEMRTLDEFCLQDVDYLKADCEGGELAALQGAIETIERCRPCCMIEQKIHKLKPNFGIDGTPAVDLLKSIGYEVRQVLSGDYIMTAA